jgi:hypothetical protein
MVGLGAKLRVPYVPEKGRCDHPRQEDALRLIAEQCGYACEGAPRAPLESGAAELQPVRFRSNGMLRLG